MGQISALDDFELLLFELCIDRALMEAQVSETRDLVPFPPGQWSVKVCASPVHGLGLFATRGISAGEQIAPARYRGMRTPAGRYTNHHPRANAIAVADGDDILFIANQPIASDAEVVVNYRQVLAVNLAIGDLRAKKGG